MAMGRTGKRPSRCLVAPLRENRKRCARPRIPTKHRCALHRAEPYRPGRARENLDHLLATLYNVKPARVRGFFTHARQYQVCRREGGATTLCDGISACPTFSQVLEQRGLPLNHCIPASLTVPYPIPRLSFQGQSQLSRVWSMTI